MKLATSRTRTRRGIQLGAGGAAREMCRRRLKFGAFRPISARVGWTPALMRWARAARSASAGVISLAPAATASWVSYSYLHFHFGGTLRRPFPAPRGESTIAGCLRNLWRFLRERSIRIHVRRQQGVGLQAATRHSLNPGPIRADWAQTVRGLCSTTTIRTLRCTSDGAPQQSSPVPYANPATLGRERNDPASRAPWFHNPSRRTNSSVTTRETARLASRASRPPRLSPVSLPRSMRRERSDLGTAQYGDRPGGARNQSRFHTPLRTTHLLSHISPESPQTRTRETQQRTSRLHRPTERTWLAQKSTATRSHDSPQLKALLMKRPVDLVWRTNANASTVVDPVPRSVITSNSSSRSTATTTATAAGRKSDNTDVCATALDPTLAQRFADDVIRRIDRRARIERERRGP